MFFDWIIKSLSINITCKHTSNVDKGRVGRVSCSNGTNHVGFVYMHTQGAWHCEKRFVATEIDGIRPLKTPCIRDWTFSIYIYSMMDRIFNITQKEKRERNKIEIQKIELSLQKRRTLK